MDRKYYLGLDIGTDSVGYAVTDEKYNIVKFHGEPAWGSMIFDQASLSEERRKFRSARRRLDRRQQRVKLIQELFASEIAKIDPGFFIRIQGSQLHADRQEERFALFKDEKYTDKDYYRQYPTIHHLINDLMTSDAPKDVRLVYIACAWLVAHRGHFLSNISLDNIDKIRDFDIVFDEFISFFAFNGYDIPWKNIDRDALADILKKKNRILNKKRELKVVLSSIKTEDDSEDNCPFSRDCLITLLAGGTCDLATLFNKEEYKEAGKVSLGMDDDKMGEIMSVLGDDYGLIEALRKLYDWSVLIDVLGEEKSISAAKVKIFEQHKYDLKTLKHFIKKYCPEKYNDVFRKVGSDNYPAYVYHTDETNSAELKKKDTEAFSVFTLNSIKNIIPDEMDEAAYTDMKNRLEVRQFMPKQKTTNNRVLPYQLYWYELKQILEHAKNYLLFLAEQDEDGISIADKIESVFTFRVPYYVGPLNRSSAYAWLKRRENGHIYGSSGVIVGEKHPQPQCLC